MSRLYLLAATLNVWVLILILVAAFLEQFLFGELPCPLCLLQRIGLMLCALGPLQLLIRNSQGGFSHRDLAVAGGLSVLTGLLGAAISTRQMLLHILPGDPGYASSVLGLHLYTWCLITFLAHVLAAGLMLLSGAWLNNAIQQPWCATKPTLIAFALVVVANIVAVIAEAGLHWSVPSEPQHYLLFG